MVDVSLHLCWLVAVVILMLPPPPCLFFPTNADMRYRTCKTKKQSKLLEVDARDGLDPFGRGRESEGRGGGRVGVLTPSGERSAILTATRH